MTPVFTFIVISSLALSFVGLALMVYHDFCSVLRADCWPAQARHLPHATRNKKAALNEGGQKKHA